MSIQILDQRKFLIAFWAFFHLGWIGNHKMVCFYVLFHSFFVCEAFTTMSAKIGIFILKYQGKIMKGPFTLSENQRESDTFQIMLPFNFHGKGNTNPLCICDGLGYPPLSRLVARRRSSSRTGLGYRRRASTHPLKRITNGGPQGSHLNPPSNGASAPAQAPCMRAQPKFSIKVVHAAAQGSLLVSRWSSHN